MIYYANHIFQAHCNFERKIFTYDYYNASKSKLHHAFVTSKLYYDIEFILYYISLH